MKQTVNYDNPNNVKVDDETMNTEKNRRFGRDKRCINKNIIYK